MPKPRKLPKHVRDEYKAFQNHVQSGQKQISDVIHDCLVLLQDEISEFEDAEKLVPAIVVSALCSIGAWPNELQRDEILAKGFIYWTRADLRTPLAKSWTLEQQPGKKVNEYRWVSNIQGNGIHKNKNLNLVQPRDGPSEIWSFPSVGFRSGRRAVLSYVHDKEAGDDIAWHGDRRGVHLSVSEVQKIRTPTFFNTHRAEGLNNVWHDGMRYPSRNGHGERNSYTGMIPYLLPGSAIWHSIPHLRGGGNGAAYLSLSNQKAYDKVIQSFVKLRSGAETVEGFGNMDIAHPTDRPYRDLSQVRRLWPIAEAVCGMLRDELIISLEDMAGLALTLMHYDCIVKDMCTIRENASKTYDEIPEDTMMCCIPRRTPITWSKLCSYGKGARGVMQQTLSNAGFVPDDEELFCSAAATFMAKVNLLKFWYALLLAPGEIRNLVDLRFEVIEDLALALAWKQEDTPKVYFMLEAAVMNHLERNIPYEESLRRVMLGSPYVGTKLLNVVTKPKSATHIRMTRAQMELMFIKNLLAFWRNKACLWDISVLRASWIAGQAGLRYVGRFTGSECKPLYVAALIALKEYSVRDIAAMATEGKQRMAVLVTPDHKLHRYVDSEENTGMEIIVASVFFLDEDEYNMAHSCFGQNHFHVTQKRFRDETSFTESPDNIVNNLKSRYRHCVVDEVGTYFELCRTPQRVYQIVVTHERGVEHARLVAIRKTECGEKRGSEPVAASPLDVMDYVKGVNRHCNKCLFVQPPDQFSPDGKSIVDYSSEYESISVDEDGHVMGTSSVGGVSAQAQLLCVVRSLRKKDWLG